LEPPGSLWLRWESRTGGSGAVEEGRREAAEALFAELAEIPSPDRGRMLGKRRFHDPGLVELLLEKSREAQPADPGFADTLAMMAALLTLRLCGPRQDAGLVAIFLGRASCLSGNARRLLGNEAEAEVAFANTVGFLGRSTASCDRAFYCRFLALLRWDQGRVDEAASLLHHAARIFGDNGSLREEGTSLSLLGLLYTEEGDFARGTSLLRKARLAGGTEPRPWLALRSRLALALGHARLGQLGKARWMLREAWGFYRGVTDPYETARAQGLEGKICSLLGAAEDADALLDSVRVRFLEDHRLPDAALATLDLALHRLESGARDAASPLIESFEDRLEARDGADVALRGLRDFQRKVNHGRPFRESADNAAAFLLRTYRFHGLRMEPLPFA
jgi:tetratricopeptide (TPR) repeat protein